MTTIEQPESGRTNQGQGSTTASGREDYIDLAGYVSDDMHALHMTCTARGMHCI